MSIATKKALKVLEAYGLSSLFMSFRQISSIFDYEGIHLLYFPFKGRIKERYIRYPDGIAQISIKTGLDIPDQKHLAAHAFGHHNLHKGSYAYIDNIVLDIQERQAEDFAAVLLVPPVALKEIAVDNVFDLAEIAEIPLHLATRRLNIFKNQHL